MSCPDANALLDFAAGRLDERAGEVIELHLDTCAVCRDLVAELFSGSRRAGPAPAGLRPGDRVGRFVVRECLGRGGMGVVYAAVDPALSRIVAIKLLHRSSRELGDEATDRLVREARAIARVAHPNVVTVFGMGVLGDEGSVVFVAMERVLGTTMRQWLGVRRRSLDEILAVFRGAAAGLGAAHGNGIVHRDFKPDNVMIDAAGVAKVMDFGLARFGVVRSEDSSPSTEIDADDKLTGTGTLMGTPAYMAPEQHDEGIIDARSDQYAFCAALFEAVCGERPFRQRNIADLLAAKRAAAFAFPAHADVPGWLRAVITRGLSPAASQRFAAMDELGQRLHRPPRHAHVATVLVAVTLLVALGPRWWPVVAEGCDTAGSSAALGWDPATRDAVTSAMRDGLPEHATAIALHGLDSWGQRWVDAHAAACATADDRVLACLATRRAAFVAVAALLQEAAPAAGARPADIIGELGDPAECRADAPGDAADHASAAAATKIRALRELGRLDDSRHEGQVAVLAARERDDERGLARLLLEFAAALQELDAWPEALAAIEESYHLAEVAGDHDTAARAAIRCVSLLTSGMPERRNVQLWLRHAEAAVERAGPSDELAIGLAVIRSRAADLEGDLVAARAHLEHAMGDAERSGSDRLHVVLSNLGVVLARSGEFAASIPVFEREREIVAQTYGADHPLLADVDVNMAGVFVATGEHAHALAVLERAEDVERGLPSLRPTSLGNIELNRAYIYLGRQNWSAAADEFRRAAAHFAEGYASGHPSTARALFGLALSLQYQGRDEESEALLWRAVEMFEAVLGAEHRELLRPLDAIADIAHDRGNFEQAIPLRRRALTITASSPIPQDTDAGEIHVGLGSDLLGLGRLDEAAVELERALPLVDTPSAVAGGSDPLRARLQLARVRLRQGRADDAIAVLEPASASLEPHGPAQDEQGKAVTEMLAEARRLAAR